MITLIEIRLHGRGSQGVKKAAQILGRAGFLAGYQTQDFSLYGAERQGAPLTGFVRLDDKAIQEVGYVEKPDFILILDAALNENMTLKGLTEKTIVIVNSENNINKKNFISIDANKIALNIVNSPQPNIVLLGAFIKAFPRISFNNLEDAIKKEMPKLSIDALAKNLRAAKQSFNQVVV